MAEQNTNQTAQTAQTTQPAQAPVSAPAATPPQASQPAAPQTTQASATAPVQSGSAVAEQVKGEDAKKPGKTYFIVALVCTALGVLFFALTFTPLAVYSLLAAILFCIASISFLGAQKKMLNFKGVLILNIVTYIIFIGLIAFFVGGVIWSMSAQ